MDNSVYWGFARGVGEKALLHTGSLIGFCLYQDLEFTV